MAQRVKAFATMTWVQSTGSHGEKRGLTPKAVLWPLQAYYDMCVPHAHTIDTNVIRRNKDSKINNQY